MYGRIKYFIFLISFSNFNLSILIFSYDENNSEHVEVKRGVEKSNGVPNIEKISVILQSLQNAGFEIIEHWDVADTKEESDFPWYYRLILPHYRMYNSLFFIFIFPI